MIGVNERGQKRFLAIEDGVRESTESWRAVLRDMKARGVKLSPKLAVGDGALGFWAALEEQFPETRHQRCWVHKTANVLNYLPKSVQSKAKAGLYEIWMAETRADAQAVSISVGVLPTIRSSGFPPRNAPNSIRRPWGVSQYRSGETSHKPT